jgi:hypothetical protein
MAVDLFGSIDRSKVDKLPFLKKGAYPFGYVDNSMERRLGIVYEVGADDALKLQKLLLGKEERTLVKGDRVFVLSGCKVPQFKIKEFLRTIGAVMVNTIEDATIMVGNTRVSKKFEDNRNLQYIDSLAMILDTVYTEVDGVKLENLVIDKVVKDFYPDLDEMGGLARFNKAATGFSANYKNSSGIRYMKCITPYVGRLVYEILSRKIVTISDECLYRQIPGAVKLDAETTKSLMSMMESSDEENQKTAHEILANCDWAGADLCLYTIARGHSHQLFNSRFKNVKLFVEESGISKLAETTEETYLRQLADDNKLTQEALDLLLPLVSKKVEARVNNVNSSVFTIKMELKPEFSNILGTHEFNKIVQPNTNLEEDEF